jgi:hypothetical protein
VSRGRAQAAHRTRSLPRLGARDREALALWLWSRLAVAVLAAAGALALDVTDRDLVGLWRRWDADLLRKVAQFGYAGYPRDYPDRGIEAFFPGFPVVLRAVHVVVPDWTAAGLVVSLLAGAVACVALTRLAALDTDHPLRAVLFLLTAPAAVFLAAGYSEALFLAAAVPAWLAARRGHWRSAGLLAAAAATVRVNGVFLAAGLVVQLLSTGRGRPRRDGWWLLAPFAVVLGYVAYLHGLTGDWLRWQHAQEEGWGRHLTAPWTAFSTTLQMATGNGLAGPYVLVARLEIGAVAVGVGLTAVLLARRRWGEAAYVGLTVASLATSTFWFSVARSMLLWFPLWTSLAAAPRWLRRGWLAVSVPLAAVEVVLFSTGRWAG